MADINVLYTHLMYSGTICTFLAAICRMCNDALASKSLPLRKVKRFQVDWLIPASCPCSFFSHPYSSFCPILRSVVLLVMSEVKRAQEDLSRPGSDGNEGNGDRVTTEVKEPDSSEAKSTTMSKPSIGSVTGSTSSTASSSQKDDVGDSQSTLDSNKDLDRPYDMILSLNDGTVIQGFSFGAPVCSYSALVFQDILRL